MSDLWTHCTSRVKQEEGHTEFLHLPSAVLAFCGACLQPSLSLVDREVEICNLCKRLPQSSIVSVKVKERRYHVGTKVNGSHHVTIQHYSDQQGPKKAVCYHSCFVLFVWGCRVIF